MNLNGAYSLLNINRQIIKSFCFTYPRNSYAKPAAAAGVMGGALKKKKGKLGPMIEKKVLAVETDPERLVSHACGTNIYKTGEDVKLLPDSEYPDWLWNVRTGPPPPLEELDPNSKEYWRRIRKLAIKRNLILRKTQRF